MKMLELYKARMKASRNVAEPHWDRAIENYKHYFGKIGTGGMSESEYPFQSQMNVPVSYEIVETILPRIIGKDPEFTPIAMEGDDVPFETTARIALESQYHNPKLSLRGEPIYMKLFKGVKEQLLIGNAVWRAYWRRENQKKPQYLINFERAGIKDSEDIAGTYKMAKKMGKEDEIKYTKKIVDSPFIDDFDLRHVPFFFFMPDAQFDMPGQMRYQTEREMMSLQDLIAEAKIFKYDEAVLKEIVTMQEERRGGFTPDISKDFMYEYKDIFQNISEEAFTTDDERVPLLIVDKMWMGDRVAVFVNEKYNLTGDLGIPNPYDVMTNPFIFGQNIPIPHSYFAYGEVDAIKKLEDGATDMLNMRFDNLIQSMLNFWVYNPNMMANGDEFVPIPNSLTAVTDVDRAVRMLKANDVTPTAYREAEEMLGIIQRVTGVNDYVKGSEGSTLAGRTYGGLRLVQEAANARFIVKSRMFEELTLKSLGYFMLEMSRQFIDKDRIKRMVGKSGDIEEATVKASELKAIKGFMDIKVVPNGSMVVDQQAEIMKFNTLADRFVSQKGPFEGIPPEVYDKFLLRFLQLYGITDAPYWIRTIKESRKELEKEQEKAASAPAAPAMPEIPAAAAVDPLAALGGGAPQIPTAPIMQSDQGIVQQPDPLAAIMGSELMPPTDLGGMPNGQY